MSIRNYLLLEFFIFVLCTSNSTSILGSDGFDNDDFCLGLGTRIPVPPNEKVLLDTQDYQSQNLITSTGESNIWASIDFDGIDNGGFINQVSLIIIDATTSSIIYIYIYILLVLHLYSNLPICLYFIIQIAYMQIQSDIVCVKYIVVFI